MVGMLGMEKSEFWTSTEQNALHRIRDVRGGAKERVNRLDQKFDKSAYIVMEIFVVYYDVLINENIISSHF